MEILWLSIRKRDDLSSSTQQGILSILASNGHRVRFVGPAGTHGQGFFDCEHIELPQKNKWGRRTSSFAQEVIAWLEIEAPTCDLIFLDWPLYTFLRSALSRLPAPKILIDRSPPASGGILSTAQWSHWKQAWKAASKGYFSAGCVVSPSHRAFVTHRYGEIHVPLIEIPAGVSVCSDEPRPYSSPVELVYHGRLDRNRGLSTMFEFVNMAKKRGIAVRLTLYGTGNFVESIKKNQSEQIHYGGNIEQHRMQLELEKFHVGLLPMPASKVWSIASPLKQNEYLAAGLPILGIDHEGHRMAGQGEYVQLFSQEDFCSFAVQFLDQLDESSYHQFSKNALDYAKNHCLWEQRCKDVLDFLSSLQE
ncbi:MAG: glycosyltransferase family 4 protein [archaeon]|nr:glycosyltransferase family 4 protein [archaeon]